MQAAELGFVAALAVADMVKALAPGASVTLKWPNDVLVDGCKMAGILLEAQSAPSGALAFVILGIGINVESHPADARYPATSLWALGSHRPSVEATLARLCTALSVRLELWREGSFEAIRADWLSRAHALGQRIEVLVGDERISGVFRSLDVDGALLLDVDGTERRLTVGDVGAAAG
jgi:BirA family biotin operon repressor/biotin-[acetyl-CoA-carboxylase] ligase